MTRSAATPSGSGHVTGRLGQGELRRKVAAHLAAHPGPHTPGQIAHALGRSAGAVGNALDTLVAGGHAEKTSTRPRRYRATATSIDATRPGPTRRTPSSGTAPRTAGAAPVAPAADDPAGVRRPNGTMYHPRLLADLPDVAALHRLREAGIPVLLYGPGVIHGLILS